MQYKEIKILVGKQHINCKGFKPEGNFRNATVVMVHGWSSSDKKYIPLGEMLSEIGFYALAVNLRGHSDSPYKLGDFSRRQHEEDIITTLRYIRDQQPNNKIVLFGKSYGGYLSAIAAEREDINLLILSQPALYPDEQYDTPTKTLIDRDPNIFKQTDQEPKFNKAIKSFSQFNGSALIIESENDEEIPKSTTGNYFKYANPKTTSVVLGGADHSVSRIEWREDFYRVVINWLLEVVK